MTQAKGKLVKASWTNSSRKSVETGSSGSLRRVRSPTPLEYALDHQVLSSSRVPQEDRLSHEGSPDYSKWVSSDYFGKMAEWLANVDLGELSQSDNWQTKFTCICQDISDIKSNNYLKENKIRKMTGTSTNFRSTKVLDNHKLLDYDRNGEDDRGASDSPYRPLRGMTKHHNSDT